jgi:hypothetical protein
MSEFSTKNTSEIINAINTNKVTDFQIYGDKINLINSSFFGGCKLLHKNNVFSKLKMEHHGHLENHFNISVLTNYLKDKKDLSKFEKFIQNTKRLCSSDFELKISNKTKQIAKDIGASHFSLSPDKKTVVLWDTNHHEDFMTKTVRFMSTQNRWTPCFENEIFDGLSNVDFQNISNLKELVNSNKSKKDDKKRRVLKIST